MRIYLAIAALTAIVGGIVVTSIPASAYQNCTTSCQRYGNQTTCTRNCY